MKTSGKQVNDVNFERMKIDQQLVTKYLNGTCTQEENAVVKAWIEENGSVFPDYSFPFDSVEEQQLKENIWAGISEVVDEEPDQTISRVIVLKRYGYYLAGIAASIVFLVGIRYAVLVKSDSQQENIAVLKELRTVKGKKARIVLRDGTIVTLNGDSKLEYPEVFNDSIRQVYLSGEAFFEVTKNPSKPFVIQTPETTTKVLGTSFSIRSYQEDRKTTLAVSSGKVLFWKKTNPSEVLTLIKGELAVATEHVEKSSKTVSSYLAWKDNKMYFEDEPLREVAKVLERKYGYSVDIEVKNEENIRLTGTFENLPLEKMLERLAYTLDIRYKKENNRIRIY